MFFGEENIPTAHHRHHRVRRKIFVGTLWQLITHGHLAEIKVGLPRVRQLFSSENAKLLRILEEKYKEIKNDHITSHNSKYVLRIFYHMDLMHIGQ